MEPQPQPAQFYEVGFDPLTFIVIAVITAAIAALLIVYLSKYETQP